MRLNNISIAAGIREADCAFKKISVYLTGIVILVFVWLPLSAWGNKPYKIYIINKYGAYDIVCDSYTVKKEDHIWEVLRRKGSIAEEDFSRFVEILKEINPSIKDVNKIYPDQKILIPLKQIPSNDSRDLVAGPRYVTVPMLPDVLYKTHAVQEGECLSKIVTAQVGVDWNEIPTSYVETLKRMNPRLKDLNLIYAGETIRIPEGTAATPTSPGKEQESFKDQETIQTASNDAAKGDTSAQTETPAAVGHEEPVPELKEEESKAFQMAQAAPADSLDRSEPQIAGERPNGQKAESLSAVDTSVEEEEPVQRDASIPEKREDEQVKTEITTVELSDRTEEGESTKKPAETSSEKNAPESSFDIFPAAATGKPAWQDVVSQVMNRIGGKLMASGHCFFPRSGGKDVALDLSAFPVVELNTGKHLLLESAVSLPEDVKKVVRSSWQGVMMVHADPAESESVVLEKIFVALFGEKKQQVLALPPFDDGVQVTLRADWVIFPEDGVGEVPAYHAITLLEHSEEKTSKAAGQYLKSHQIFVLDVVPGEVGGEEMTGPEAGAGISQSAIPTFLTGANQEAFVSAMATALGFLYESQAPIFFDYAGFQVQTTGNLIYGGPESEVVVDFGTFYGEAKSAIEAGGMRVLSITAGQGPEEIVPQLLSALGSTYTENPNLFIANRIVSKTISLVLPGYLVPYGKEKKAFLTYEAPVPVLLEYLSQEKIDTLVLNRGWGTQEDNLKQSNKNVGGR